MFLPEHPLSSSPQTSTPVWEERVLTLPLCRQGKLRLCALVQSDQGHGDRVGCQEALRAGGSQLSHGRCSPPTFQTAQPVATEVQVLASLWLPGSYKGPTWLLALRVSGLPSEPAPPLGWETGMEPYLLLHPRTRHRAS